MPSRIRTRLRSKTRTRLETQSSLTASQYAAVTHGRGPALILAGAGTGKTKVLVERVAWLTQAQNVPPQQILVLTFTDKAANELDERLSAALPVSALQPWVGTFHRFAEHVLREHAFSLGLDHHFRILSPPEAWLLLKRHLFTLPLNHLRPLGNPTKYAQALVSFFSNAKDQGITPKALAEFATSQKKVNVNTVPADDWSELAAAYQAYVDLQRREGVMDFGDLMLEAERLFREQTSALAQWRTAFPYILVDEFQDTNTTQFNLLELLAGPRGNLIAASDDDQAIFAFRGSNVANVLRFREKFPRSALYVLTENFRSPQILLDHAYQLIQNNNPHRLEVVEDIPKRLTASGDLRNFTPDDAATVARHLYFETEEDEFGWVAQEILRLVDKGSNYRDVAILTRTNTQAADVVTSLLRRDIPHTVREARGLLARPEIKDVLAYFNLLTDPADGRAVFRLLSHPAFNIGTEDLTLLLTRLKRTTLPAFSVLSNQAALTELSEPGKRACGRLTDLLRGHMATLRTARPSQLYLEFLEQSGILKHVVGESERHPYVLTNFQSFLAYVRSLEVGLTGGDFLEFTDVLAAAAESGEGPSVNALSPDTDAVHVLTVHAAKGLEFPHVFMIGVTTDRYPTRNRSAALSLPPSLVPIGGGLDKLGSRELHVLEERRLFYVALTRAQQKLILTSSATAAGARLRRKPSPFIVESGITSVAMPSAAQSAVEQLTLPLPLTSHPLTPRSLVRLASLSLSASKISDFLLCPLRYHYRYTLGIPTPPLAVFSFGSTMHGVLHDIAKASLRGQPATPEDALRWYDRQWISEGYESVEHERARKEAGRVALRTYLDTHNELVRLPPLAAEILFSFTLEATRVTGRIDRIDRAPGNPSPGVIITDFKTGEGKDRDAASDFQLSVYALAARRALKLEPVELRLSFIEAGRDDITTRTPEDDARTAQEITAVAERVRSGDTSAKPGFHCRFCDFRTICDYAQLA